MSGLVVLIIAVGVIAFLSLALNAALLQVSCCICRAEIPAFGRAVRISFLSCLVCVVVIVICGCLIGLLASGADLKNAQSVRMQTGISMLLLNTVVTAVVYSWMVPTSFVRGILIAVVQYGICLGLAVLTVPLMPPHIRQVVEKMQAGGPADTVAIRKFLDQTTAKWKTKGAAGSAGLFQSLADAQKEAAGSDGTLVSLTSKWRLLETRDMGSALVKEGMPGKATTGKFILITYQGPARTTSSSQVVCSPTLVDSQGRQFKPLNESMFYLPEGLRFMTVTRLSSGATETFRSIYEVAADSQGLCIQGQRPAEESQKNKTPL